MLPVLYQLFPNDFHRLVEVFGGGAAVIFGREPGRCEESYNDYNSNLVTLFWCVKNRPLALMTELNFLPLNSRQEFEVLRKFLREEEFTNAYLREELELCERFFLSPDREELRQMLQDHMAATGSEKARQVLDDFDAYLPRFKKIIPGEYKKLMQLSAQFEEQGMNREEAQIEAFYASVAGKEG